MAKVVLERCDKNMTQSKKGIFFAVFGTMMWGLSGNFAQLFFERTGLEATWLVSVRMLIAGILLTLIAAFRVSRKQWHRYLQASNLLRLVIFALFGMVPSQLTYFLAIQHGNASSATILQFLGPLFIIIYLALKNWKLPRRIDVISIVMALVGTVLVVTQGNLAKLAIAPLGLFWGIMAGVSQALYTLLPRKLLQEFDVVLVTGSSMVIGGLVFTPALVQEGSVHLDGLEIGYIAFIALMGTLIAYLFYLNSLNYLAPETTGMLSCFEPLTATLVAVFFMGLQLQLWGALGIIMVLSTVFLQGLSTKKQNSLQDRC
ncbi:DMT family permease [Ligilactobacillus equi DSM 15833 = JCM 10991]|nr:DMT family permease [Ligilactobacillus equi DSM 15833 = JCM 10991]